LRALPQEPRRPRNVVWASVGWCAPQPNPSPHPAIDPGSKQGIERWTSEPRSHTRGSFLLEVEITTPPVEVGLFILVIVLRLDLLLLLLLDYRLSGRRRYSCNMSEAVLPIR
jgi:hypothetical protein